MARKASPVPDALEMRVIKYEAVTTVEQRDRTAELLRSLGRRSEAILLYDGRADHPALAEDLRWAIEAGASFTLFSLKRMGVPVTDDHVRACAVAAEAKERWYDAHRCYEALADDAALSRVRERVPGYKVAVPENKK